MAKSPHNFNPYDIFPAEVIHRAFKGGNMPCKYMHPGTCEWDAVLRFFKIFFNASKFYAPIHMIPVLIFKMKKLKTEPWKVIKGYLKNVYKSCMFLATYMTILKYGMCLLKHLIGLRPLHVILAGMLSFPGMFFEASGRRTEMSLYFLSPFIESVWRWLDKRALVYHIPNGDVYLFSVCVAILMYCYERHPKTIKSTYLSLFKLLWGEN